MKSERHRPTHADSIESILRALHVIFGEPDKVINSSDVIVHGWVLVIPWVVDAALSLNI